MSGAMIETWRGCVNSWECDENGHMNVRFYVAKWQEGLAFLAQALSLPGAFSPRAAATLLPRDQHIRFLAEAHAGAALSLHGGVIETGEDWVNLYQEMRHMDGRIAAAFTTRVAHVGARDARPFRWPQRMAPLAASLQCTPPKEGQPRSIDFAKKPTGIASIEAADRLGALRVGAFVVAPQHLDAFGRLTTEWVIGRLSDAAPNLFSAWRQIAAKGLGKRIGGAVLEYRLVYQAWPKAGDLIEVRSGLVGFEGKTQRVVHWLLDPVSGAAWASAEVVAVSFDLDTRKAIEPPEDYRAAMAAKIIPGLAI